MVDITRPLEKFIAAVDSEVEDLGYNVEGILREYSSFRYGAEGDYDYTTMCERIYGSNYVNNPHDAGLIAKHALDILFTLITKEINNHGYRAAIVHDMRLKLSALDGPISGVAVLVVM